MRSATAVVIQTMCVTLYTEANPFLMSSKSKRPRRQRRKPKDVVFAEQVENQVVVDGEDLNPLLHAGSIARASGPSAVAGAEVTKAHEAAMQHADAKVEEGKRHEINLPDKFELEHVKVHVQCKNRRTFLHIEDFKHSKRFTTLPTFLRHLKDVEHNMGHIFEIDNFIDSARKQIGYLHREKAKINPAITNQTAITPPAVYNFLQQKWKLNISSFDPCPVNPTFDGLDIDWTVPEGETIYVNPPFKYAGKWARKIVEEIKAGHCKSVVLLCGARLQPEWFHETVMQYASVVCVVRRGITFVGYSTALPHGTIIAHFKTPLRKSSSGTKFVSEDVHKWD